VSLEFADPLFSGNGVYARTIVRSLLLSGFEVLVLSGRPSELDEAQCDGGVPGAQVLTISCDIWKRLDRYSSWNQFAVDSAQHAAAVSKFQPAVCIGVDWTSIGVLTTLQSAQAVDEKMHFCYMNFRIATNSTGVSADDIEFYRQKEAQAMVLSDLRVALCKMDSEILHGIFPMATPPAVLSPPLREDIRKMALEAAERPQLVRKYLTCCSRITPEKNVHKFVELCIALRPFLASVGIVPYLVGASVAGDYASDTIDKLKAAFPGESCITKEFMPPDELSKVYCETALLVLPSLYDSWGMVVTEAAAFGASTLLHNCNIGVADLLLPSELSLTADFSATDIAEVAQVAQAALADRDLLQAMACRAQEASMGWNEVAFSSQLAALLQSSVSETAAP